MVSPMCGKSHDTFPLILPRLDPPITKYPAFTTTTTNITTISPPLAPPLTSKTRYSSEVAGTIIVQCVPILRPFVRDVHQSLTSKRIASDVDPARRSFTWAVSNRSLLGKEFSTNSNKQYSSLESDHGSGSGSIDSSATTITNGFNFGFSETKITGGAANNNNNIELRTIQEERDMERRDSEKMWREGMLGKDLA